MTDKNKLQTLINQFSGGDLRANSIALFKELGYQSPRTFNKPVAEILRGFDHEKALCSEWINAPFLFQLAEDNLSNIQSLLTEIDGTIIESYMFVAIELKQSYYSRSDLVKITRELNKSPQPVLILFKHGETLTLSVIHRRLHKRDDSKDVLEKVTLLKDIRIANPHRAHLDILESLAFDNLKTDKKSLPKNFVELHQAWQKILSITPLNTLFYSELAFAFTKLVGGERKIGSKTISEVGVLKLPSVIDETVKKEFAVRLIGRLLFCWFLKKKNLIPENLLSFDSIQNYPRDYDYYHSVLEPLFFEVLNKKSDDRFDVYKSGDWQKIPFLNGGLFEAHFEDFYQRNDLGISDYLNTLIVPDDWFSSLFKLLEDYHFTIQENTPLEIEISIDPEMLGLVFENLLAEINDETGKEARKSTGSFYTPREIVDYMVDESLRAYFKSKFENTNATNLLGDHDLVGLSRKKDLLERLNKLLDFDGVIPEFSLDEKKGLIRAINTCKILDPACGSGAFPIGILHKLVLILRHIDPSANLWLEQILAKTPDPQLRQLMRQKLEGDKDSLDYIRKLGVIRDCIHGVDIQAIATEITKLRCFLSLIVDEKVDPLNEDNQGVIPLPSLEFKFVCANTLISLFNKGTTNLFEDKNSIEELKNLRDDYLTSYGERKKEIKNEFEKLQTQMLSSTGSETLNLATWQPFKNKPCLWFDAELMFGIQNGFDIVIGNPPYLRVQGLDEKDKKEYAKRFQSATGAYDLYVLFTEKGLELLNSKGILNFIQPDKWVNASLGKGLRKITANHIAKLISFKHHQVFNASTYSSLLWITKEKQQQMLYAELDRDLPDNNDLNNWLRNLNADDFTANNNENLSEEAWVFTKPEASKILKKLAKQSRKVKDVFEKIFQGIATSKDDVYFLENCREEGDFIVGYSKSSDEEVKIEKGILKPLLKGDNVHRWENLKLENYVIFPYHVESKEYQNEVSLMPEKFIVDNFELGLRYLKNNENSLRMREKGNFDNEQWYQFSRNQGIRFEGKPKLLCRDICQKSQFTFDEAGSFYTTTTVYGYIKYPHIKEDYKFFLAILNSSITWYFMQNTSAVLSGGYYRYMPRYIAELPIPKIPADQQKPLVQLVDYILFIKKQPFYTSTDLNFAEERLMSNFFENLIDALVYELYFPEELHEAKKQFMSLVVQENLPDLDSIEGDKVGALKQIVRRLTDKNHPLYNNLFFLDSVPVVRIIEGKA